MRLNANHSFLETPPKSYWIASTENTNYPELNEDLEVDVAIVGGGMVGIMSAYLLVKSGLKVAILESDSIAKGASGHTTAKITSQHGLIYNTLFNDYGFEMAKQYADSNQWAITFIENIINELNIDCDFSREDAYLYTQSQDYIDKLKAEFEVSKQIGIDSEFVKEIGLPFSTLGAVKFKNQGQFHPRKYLLHVAKQFVENGGLIFEGTKAIDIDRTKPCKIITEQKCTVYADKVIVACKFPFTDNIGLYFTRMYQVRSYITGMRIEEDLPIGMYINVEKPSRSLRSQISEDENLLLVVGEDHKVGHGGETSQHYNNLYDFANEHYSIIDVPYRWSTQDLKTPDDIPYIGNITKSSEDVYIGTGFKKWGMSTSHVAAKLISDMIIGEENPWRDLYSPYRKMRGNSTSKLINQNIEVAKDLIMGKLQVLPKDIKLTPGQGHLVEIDGKKLGAYMDADGKIYMVDTTCTHLGCQLTWNNAEKSWDCPCHGSRFDYKGEVINGPATDDLSLNDD